MKFLWNAFFGTSVLSVQAIAGDNPDYANCKTTCTQALNAGLAKTCDPWKQKLPRPHAHNACLGGYRAGAELACPSECDAGDPVNVKQGRIQACKEWKAKRDQTITAGCEDGFKAALDLAKEAAANLIDPVVIAAKEKEKKLALEQKQAQAEAQAAEAKAAAQAQAEAKAAQAKAEAEAKAAQAKAEAEAEVFQAQAAQAQAQAEAEAKQLAEAEAEEARVSAAEVGVHVRISPINAFEIHGIICLAGTST